MVRPKVLVFLVPTLISGLFLWLVLNPPSVFNMLPFAIHEAINPGGSSEKIFIIVFDILIALLLFVLSYKLVYKLFNK
jgi:hypothetical protein